MGSKKKRHGICTYCGKRGKVTDDHVPPRSLFAKPRPPLITVPACHQCHARTTKDDEYFTSHIALRQVSSGHDAASARERFIRSLKHPRKRGWRKAFFRTVFEAPLVTPAGLYVGRRGGFEVDLTRIDVVVERTVRGLYLHHFGTRLPPDAEVRSFSEEGMKDLDSEALETLAPVVNPLMMAAVNDIGDGSTFRYQFQEVEGQPLGSAWLLTVYGATRFVVITLPRDLADELDAGVPEDG